MSTNGREVRLDASLLEEVEAHAAAQGGSLEDLVNGLIRSGLDAELGGTPLDRLDAMERKLSDVSELLNIVGPAVIGVQNLLAHWASKSRDVQVSEELLMAELMTYGQEAWALRAGQRGVLVPVPPPASSASPETDGQGVRSSATRS